jgi:hypothetical protein
VCCTALVVDTPEFRKLPGITCANCKESGCAIYATRFPICRSYFCGWIQSPELGDEWRPDRSGVILSPQTTSIPLEFETREGVELLVVGGADAIRRPGFAPFVLNLVASRIAVYLAVPGPVGHYPARALLNRPLAALAQQRDTARALDLLLQIFRSATGHTFEPVVFES